MGSNTSIVGRRRGYSSRWLGIAAASVVVLTACGQKGNLFLPTEAAARDRATLPQVLSPGRSTSAPISASPAPNPALPATPTSPASAPR